MEKTPEKRRLRSKSKYDSSPNIWKDKLRKGCFERLKNQRHKLISSLRETGEPKSHTLPKETINQVMLDEWNELRLHDSSFRDLPNRPFSCVFSKNDDEDFPEDIEDVLNVFEDLQNELLREEERLLAEYEEKVNFDDQYLCAAIEMLSTDSVLCPVCKRNNLLQNHQVIFCACGVRVDTKHDSINLQYVKKQLDENVESHSVNCNHQADFYIADISGTGMENLIMTCQHCDGMAIII